MKILFIIDPLKQLHLETDTTFAIMAEACRRKHKVWIAYLEDLRLEQDIPFGRLKAIAIHEKEWRIGKIQNTRLDKIPVIFMRKDPPFTIDYVMATSLLSLVNQEKTFIINNPAALRNFNEKLGILQFPQFIPPTAVSKKYADIIAFLKKYKKIVLKPLEGFAGREIFVLHEKDKNRNALLEMTTQSEKRYIMCQKYLPAVEKGDKRILILNGEILGQQNRIAAKNDYRSNISAGGTSHKTRLTLREREIAKTVGKVLKSQEIYFAGIDMIGEYITEINITSPTGLVKMNKHEGIILEKQVMDFVEKCKNQNDR